MKSSTTKNSSNEKKAKEYTLQGLVFMPKKKPENFFPSVYAWVTSGRPNNAVIYDTVDVLIDCQVPICDAVVFNGLYRRVPISRPHKTVAIRLSKKLVVVTNPAKSLKTVDGIKKADPKDHHKMNYQ